MGSVIIVSAAESTNTDSVNSDVGAEQSAASHNPNSPAASATAAAGSTSTAAVETRAASNSLTAPRPGHRHTLSHTEDRFAILKVLGEGASCKVVSVRDRRSGSHYAMKIMDKSEPYNGVLFENEALILRTLQHPNILQYVESYEDKNTYHLLTVLCQGGELFDRVKNGSFSELSAAQLAKQMLQALSYCHSHSIVHRDLKVNRPTQPSMPASHRQQQPTCQIEPSQPRPAIHPVSLLINLPDVCCVLCCCCVVSRRTLCLLVRLTTALCS